MLPSNILSRFTLVKVESTDDTISIHLDEKIPSDYQNNPNIESKGFLSPVTVRDFPIRDKFAAFLKEVYGDEAYDLPFA